jgi:hypothetical protein
VRRSERKLELLCKAGFKNDLLVEVKALLLSY